MTDISKIKGMKIPSYTTAELKKKLSKKTLWEFFEGVYGNGGKQMELFEQNQCKYCRTQHISKHNVTYGKTISEKQQWFDWKKRQLRREVQTNIQSPEFKHPRLVVGVHFHDGAENLVTVDIKYCPFCGRKLGDVNK